MPKLHANVTLAEGVTVPQEAWVLHGEILQCGVPRHRVIVNGFPLLRGMLSISVDLSPLDKPVPLQQRES
jgi:hypothetical protein